jgi:Acyl-CoA dehydrogenase, C-terminal domain
MRDTIGRDTVGEYERAAHAEGLAAGLAAVLTGVAPAAAPGPVAALPADRVPPGAAVIRHRLADAEGVAFVRRAGATPLPADRLTALGARLGEVRLGVTRRLVEQAVEHVSGRISGGEPTIRKQLVAGVLADLLTAVEAVRRCLRVAGDVPAAVADVHDRLTAMDWEAAKLLGAGGYLAGSPARGAHVSRLTANCWIVREGAPAP